MTTTGSWDRFAKLIAGDHGNLRVRNPDGHYRATPWPDTEPDVPYAVHLFDRHHNARVLAIDLDASRGDVQQDVAYLRLLLDDCDARYVIVRSGPEGGTHVHVPFADPLPGAAVRSIAAALTARLTTFDPSALYNTTTGAIRPPGSPHPRGGHATVDGPTADAIETLTDGNPTTVLHTLFARLDLDERLLRTSRAPLHPRLYRMLRDGTGAERYESLSEAVMALATSVITRGHDPNWLRKQLTDERNAFTVLLHNHTRRDGSRRDARRLIEAAIRKADDFTRTHPSINSREDVDDLIDHVQAHAATDDWTGRTGLSALAALQAALTTVDRCGSIYFNLSQRTLCEHAGFRTRATADRAMRTLSQRGYVKLVKNGTPTLATTWQLRRPSGPATVTATVTALRTPTPTPAGNPAGPTQTTARDHHAEPYAISGKRPAARAEHIGHPLFAWRQLGKAAGRVLSTLQNGPTTARTLTQVTGLHRTTVRNALTKLASLEHPLVDVDQSGRWHLCTCRPVLDELDMAAATSGAAAAAAELVTRHEHERANWRRYMAERAHIRRFQQAPSPPRAGPVTRAA